MDDLSLLVNHVGQNLLFSEDLTVASFADSPAAETAARVNAAAVAAGFHDNEIFTSLQLVGGVSFALIFMWVYMPSEDRDYAAETVVYTQEEAREALGKRMWQRLDCLTKPCRRPANRGADTSSRPWECLNAP